jgi:hypothetical protein
MTKSASLINFWLSYMRTKSLSLYSLYISQSCPIVWMESSNRSLTAYVRKRRKHIYALRILTSYLAYLSLFSLWWIKAPLSPYNARREQRVRNSLSSFKWNWIGLNELCIKLTCNTHWSCDTRNEIKTHRARISSAHTQPGRYSFTPCMRLPRLTHTSFAMSFTFESSMHMPKHHI